MNINDFTNSIDKKIIDRGYSYYIEGNINDLYKSNHDEYIVHIVGSSSYKVRVQMLDNGDIVRSTCNCPYDFGPTCKHEVAAYFLLAERWREENIPVRMEATIQTILSNLSKEELIEIIIKITDDDPTFEQNILFKYTSKDDNQTLESSKKLINAIVKKYQGREGFISYYDAADFANELEEIADNTRKMKNPIVALDIAFILLEEAIDAISYSDDSSGGIGFLIKQIIESIHEIVADEPKDISEELFWELLEQVDNEVLDGWTDYKIDLLTICIDLVEEEEHVVLLTFKIKSMITENSSEYYSKYLNEKLLQLLYELIKEHGSKEEAEQFVYDHLKYRAFREILLNKYLLDRRFDEVIEIAKMGEEQDAGYRGLESKWQAYRYEGLKGLSLKDEQQELAWDLFLKGDFDYYYDLKKLSTDSETEFYEKVKLELQKESGGHYRSLLLQLIKEENDIKALLEFVKKHPMYVEEYADVLFEHYEQDMIEIYREYIESEAKASSNRKQYRKFCYRLNNFKKYAGKEQQIVLIEKLMEENKRRPAFLDELNKLL